MADGYVDTSGGGPLASQTPRLRRVLGVWGLSLYGLGTIVGAGIYVLVGEVAAYAGEGLVLAFAVAGLLAGLTGLSYAALSSRFPRSAGVALFVHAGFGSADLARAAGLLVCLTGVVSAATITRGFVGYLNVFLPVAAMPVMVLLVLAVTGLAAWGIRQAAGVIVTVTVLEVAGLIYVVWAGLHGIGRPIGLETAVDIPATGILLGAFIAFYAFIGFEDMVNIAEEVKQPERTMPRGILAAVVMACVLYMVVAMVSQRTLPPEALAASDAPLAALMTETGRSALPISVIGMVAVVNGALVQIIMASRLLYGMASGGLAPRWLASIHPRTRTPIPATLLVAGCVLAFALWLPLGTLAELTSFIILFVFVLVNASLWRLQGGADWRGRGGFDTPRWVPVAGTLTCAGILAVRVVTLMV